MKTIKIKDYYGIYQEIPVSDELYEEWRALQNETQRIHRKEVYHRDWTPMDDLEEMPQHFTLNELEDALIWDEQVVELYAAISQLTPIQQRRIRAPGPGTGQRHQGHDPAAGDGGHRPGDPDL